MIDFLFSDDKTYFESQVEDSDNEKLQVVADTQREMFLQFISNDLTKLIPQRQGGGGMSPAVTDLEMSTNASESSETAQKQEVVENQEIQVGYSICRYKSAFFIHFLFFSWYKSCKSNKNVCLQLVWV